MVVRLSVSSVITLLQSWSLINYIVTLTLYHTVVTMTVGSTIAFDIFAIYNKNIFVVLAVYLFVVYVTTVIQ
jgi:hypothetical protein